MVDHQHYTKTYPVLLGCTYTNSDNMMNSCATASVLSIKNINLGVELIDQSQPNRKLVDTDKITFKDVTNSEHEADKDKHEKTTMEEIDDSPARKVKRRPKLEVIKVLCQHSVGCRDKDNCGGVCRFCISGETELCSYKACQKLRWEKVRINYTNYIGVDSLSFSDKRSPYGVVEGVCYDFRCTICKKIPRRTNRAELYRHYSTQHFNTQFKKEFGHLKICPICDMTLKSKIASHFGQKHDMVEKYLPFEARIPKSASSIHISEGNAKYQLRKAEKEKMIQRAGNVFNIQSNIKVELIEDMENPVPVKETSNIPKLLKDSEEDVQSVLCQVCNRKLRGNVATVLHMQSDHHMSGPDSLQCHVDSLVKSGHVIPLPVDIEAVCQDKIPQDDSNFIKSETSHSFASDPLREIFHTGNFCQMNATKSPNTAPSWMLAGISLD